MGAHRLVAHIILMSYMMILLINFGSSIILERACDSDTLSIESLQRIIDEDIIDTEDLDGSPFFHLACYNKNISGDIVNYLLDFYPDAAEIATDYFCLHLSPHQKTTSYPLHLACLNSHCSSAMIVDILKRNPTIVGHMCIIGRTIQTGGYDHTFVEGMPLHYYLSRTSNVDLRIVELFMKLDPNSTRTADEEALFGPIHVLCCNPGVNDMIDVLRFVIDSDPESVQFPGGDFSVPFLMACQNTCATVKLANLLLEYWPEAIHQKDSSGRNAMHLLSLNDELDEEASEELFHFLLEKKFELLREIDRDDFLSIHYAAWNKSPEFCQLLIHAYPESIMVGVDGSLPFHEACAEGMRVDTVRFLFEQYPECISMRDDNHYLPIHRAAENQLEQAAEIIKYLILQDPDASSKLVDGRSLPLHLACGGYGVDLNTVKVLFDDYPEAMYKVDNDRQLPIDMAERRDVDEDDTKAVDTVAFLKEQLTLVNKAKEEPSVRLPLHYALCENISLGAIKLIVNDFPASIHTSNDEGVLPLHIVCERTSVDIVKYLVGMDESHLGICDSEGT